VYGFELSITDPDPTLLALLAENEHIKIYVGQENSDFLLGEGDITNLNARSLNDIKSVTASFQSHYFKHLQTTKVEDVVLNGDPIREITKLIDSKGLKTSIDVFRTENIKYVANGYLYNILRRAARDRGVIWNVSNETLFVGNKLSEKKHYFKQQEVISFSTSFLNTNGVMFRKHDVSMKFNSAVNPGDVVVIDSRSYIVGGVDHFFMYRHKNNVMVKTTRIFCFEKVENLYWYAEFMDAPFHEVDHILDDRMVKEMYDVDGSRVAYKDLERNLWVGDNEKIFFADSIVGPGQSYLFIGGTQCSATVGYYIPYEYVITDMRAMMGNVDIAYLEIMRNGVVEYRMLCNATLKYDKMSLRFMPGILAVRYTPGVGAAGITTIICELNYRKVLNV
jgi:hypothetical protein